MVWGGGGAPLSNGRPNWGEVRGDRDWRGIKFWEGRRLAVWHHLSQSRDHLIQGVTAITGLLGERHYSLSRDGRQGAWVDRWCSWQVLFRDAC